MGPLPEKLGRKRNASADEASRQFLHQITEYISDERVRARSDPDPLITVRAISALREMWIGVDQIARICKHLLDLARTYQRAADAIAPLPPAEPQIFRRIK